MYMHGYVTVLYINGTQLYTKCFWTIYFDPSWCSHSVIWGGLGFDNAYEVKTVWDWLIYIIYM